MRESASCKRRNAILSIAFGAAMLWLAVPASAATYKPNVRNDHVPDGPNGCTHADCTLREAVIEANSHIGGDKIVLRAGKTYKLQQPGTGEDASGTGDLDINGDSLTVLSSSNKKPAIVDGRGVDRVFQVGPAAPADTKFELLRIQGGVGGIMVNAGSVKIVKTTVSNNTNTSFGGGLNLVGGKTVLQQSTVSSNAAVHAGGIAAQGDARLTAVNSTVAGNSTVGTGGGIDVFGSAITKLKSVSVVRNHANTDNMGGQDGGGLYNSASTTVTNSIIALNTVGAGGGGTGPDCYGMFAASGVNLLSNSGDCSGLGGPPDITAAKPKLARLKKNGGPTKTVALGKQSPAVNHAGSGSPKRDQRGVKRNNPDIGAFERR